MFASLVCELPKETKNKNNLLFPVMGQSTYSCFSDINV